MMEYPEAVTMARQITDAIQGKRITDITAGHTPHKLAWYYGDREAYSGLLVGKTVGKASPCGNMVEIAVGKAVILLAEGVEIRFHDSRESLPARHQFLVEFTDGSALSAGVRMYGGMGCFPAGKLENPYYRVAKEKPAPLASRFDEAYFERMIGTDDAQKLSLKALLATQQRIPGLGNGILQDILFNARLHPKKKTNTLTAAERKKLFHSVKSTISEMAAKGGRDMEMDLYGHPGGYQTLLSKNTFRKPCCVCGGSIRKEAYLGGAIYYCEKCQKI